MYVCIMFVYVCMYACVCVCACMYMYMCVCVYVRTFFCRYVCKYGNTVELGYNDIGLCDTSPVMSDILRYQLIPYC